ncbi:MAG: pyrroline-5-carboxylate reductase [Lachnospiraceae bacterium]|nr:pyrroline-5-carboxylate reductase [Lachnospiraceae bacterium]MDD3615352.1 pyrroline-5-carboxylate reductase [Lachnospiraceae bacterium]
MKLGFIGCGNMAKAMLGGALKQGVVTAEDVYVSTATQSSLEKTTAEYKVKGSLDNLVVADYADVLVLAVKPYLYESVIAQIRSHISENQLIISIAPGKTLAWLQEQFQGNKKIIRTMPNTPALVGEGMTGVCYNELVTEEDMTLAGRLFDSFGKYQIVAEHLMDAVVSVSGSSPAYVFMFIEAMADAAVSDGLPRAQAYEFAAQAVLGSAKMVLETGKHPGELKDMVCSPAGTTIEAVRVLEEKGFRSSVIEAMKACTAKTKGV